ncbi:MAG: hypothetical protein JWQ09_5278 [Segetibacter sp.]|nr:hypothetical protein [Segetibacter sp.]
MTITITKLYELLSNKTGKDEAENLTTYIEEKIFAEAERDKSAIVSELKAEIEKSKSTIMSAMIIMMTPLYLTIIAIAYTIFIKR